MENEYEVYKEMLENFYEGVYFVDVERKITFWNKGAERITGFEADELLGRNCFDNILNHVDDNGKELCFDGCPLHATMNDGQNRQAGVYLHHKDGHRVSVAVRTIPLKLKGEIVGAVEVFVDDEEKAEINKKISKLEIYALYDQLTELPNRRYIDSYLGNRVKEYKELEIPFAVAMIDIDHFKIFNDTYGHDVGDRVLKMVARTLKNSFRKNDFVGRWGGEEFMAVLTGVDEDDLFTIANKARTLVEMSSLREQGESLNVKISIGVTLIKDDDSVEQVQKRADEALYSSKETGRNKVTVL